MKCALYVLALMRHGKEENMLIRNVFFMIHSFQLCNFFENMYSDLKY